MFLQILRVLTAKLFVFFFLKKVDKSPPKHEAPLNRSHFRNACPLKKQSDASALFAGAQIKITALRGVLGPPVGDFRALWWDSDLLRVNVLSGPIAQARWVSSNISVLGYCSRHVRVYLRLRDGTCCAFRLFAFRRAAPRGARNARGCGFAGRWVEWISDVGFGEPQLRGSGAERLRQRSEADVSVLAITTLSGGLLWNLTLWKADKSSFAPFLHVQHLQTRAHAVVPFSYSLSFSLRDPLLFYLRCFLAVYRFYYFHSLSVTLSSEVFCSSQANKSRENGMRRNKT